MESNQALALIEDMIHSAKRDIKDNGFYYMFWGYLVFLSALTDYLLSIQQHEQHALIWAIAMPFGGIVSIIKGFKDKKKQQVVTYVDEMFKQLMVAFSISLVIVCFIMPMTQQNWRSFFPTLMVVYAFALYVSGGIIRFKPLQYGALAVWILGAAAFFVGYQYQLLILAAGVLLGFVIPGHMLNYKFKQHV
jgi:hypothetical protein